MGVLTNFGNVPVYYREASIFINGRYNREISIKDAMKFKQQGVEKFGPRLNKVDIEYKSKKSGIHVKFWHISEEDAAYCFSLKDRTCFHRTTIFYGRSGNENPKKVIVNNDNWKEITM